MIDFLKTIAEIIGKLATCTPGQLTSIMGIVLSLTLMIAVLGGVLG